LTGEPQEAFKFMGVLEDEERFGNIARKLLKGEFPWAKPWGISG
jgi:hypothetical protein